MMQHFELKQTPSVFYIADLRITECNATRRTKNGSRPHYITVHNITIFASYRQLLLVTVERFTRGKCRQGQYCYNLSSRVSSVASCEPHSPLSSCRPLTDTQTEWLSCHKKQPSRLALILPSPFLPALPSCTGSLRVIWFSYLTTNPENA